MRRFSESTEIRVRFPRPQIIKLSRLLDMEYKPSEIAEEIDVSLWVIYNTYLHAGCPHRREKGGQIWIHGLSFAAWARSVNAADKKNPFTLQADEAWCTKCNAVVKMLDPHERKLKSNLIMVYGTCSVCSGKVNRLASGKGKK
ncbi:MAG: DUF5679 domain-containing protein [Anaerolineaceae bacterium]